MKNVFLIYEQCCFYEITILSYFLSATKEELLFCSPDGKSVRCMEGFCVNADMALKEVNVNEIRSLIITGGETAAVNRKEVHGFLRELRDKNVLIGAICAGVRVLEDAGIIQESETPYNCGRDVINNHHVITARPNAYVDFAIEVAKELDLFEDERDLQETIDFWKYHKRPEQD